MPPAIVGHTHTLSDDANPMDHPHPHPPPPCRPNNPLSKPHLVKVRRRVGSSLSRAPPANKPPVEGFNPFGGAEAVDLGSSDGSPRRDLPPGSGGSVLGFGTNRGEGGNVVKGSAGSSAAAAGWGTFVFGNSSRKVPENEVKDGKENKPVFVFGASESASSLPEKMQTWHPSGSNAGSKGGSSDVGGFVFGGGASSVPPEGKDVTAANIDSVREKLEKTVHISSSSPPAEKVENVNFRIPDENSEEMRKVNLQNAKGFGGTENSHADVLPEKVERLNLGGGIGNLETKPTVFVFGTRVNDSAGSRQTSGESTRSEQFVFGGSSVNSFSDNMKFNMGNKQESYTPGAFSFNLRDWETETKMPEATLPDAMRKLEIGARKTAGLKDKKGKKKPPRLGKPKMTQPRGPFWPEYSGRASSSEKDDHVPVTEPVPGSPAGYSPMECSPYRESDSPFEMQGSTSLETEAEVELAAAAKRLEIKEENLNNNEKPTEKEVHENKVKESDGSFASGISLNLNGFVFGSTSVASNVGSKEEAAQGMDYVESTSNNVETGNAASGSSFKFTASTSSQGTAPVIRRHFRRKNRVTRGSVDSTADHAASSSVQSSSQRTDASTSPFGMQVDSGKTESRSRTETKKETTGTSSTSSGVLEACEKWRMRGNQAYADGRLQKAEEYYTRGINSVASEERSGSCARALMLCYSNRAATRMSLGRMREAFVDCLIALEADPGFLRARVRAANCLLALGEVDEAIKYYNQCIQSDGVDSKILAEAREGLGKTEKFTRYVDQATQLLQKGTSDEVAKVLELISDAMLIGMNSDNLMEMKAKALLLLRRYEEVVQLCEQSLELAKKNSNFGRSGARDPRLWRWLLLAKSYFYLGKLEEAIQVLKNYQEVKPIDDRSSEIYPSPDVIRELLRLKKSGNEAFQAGRYAEAIESYTAALTYNGSSRPFSAICFGNRAASYQAQGQIMDAIADCSLAIALDPNYAKAISRRATLYETIRDYSQAANDIRRLISLLEKQSQLAAHGKSSKSNTELQRALARLSSMEDEARRRTPLNMYLILGIEQTSSSADVKKAYRKAALRHHPDKAGQFLVRSETVDDTLWNEIVQEVHKDADHLFKIIGEAYNVLSDETKRLKYDVDEEVRSGKRSQYSEFEEYTGKRHYERAGSRHSWKSHHRWSDDYYW